jgi:hypothetical protein
MWILAKKNSLKRRYIKSSNHELFSRCKTFYLLELIAIHEVQTLINQVYGFYPGCSTIFN